MRIAVFLALGIMCACASQKLAVAPPPGVDFSGRWHLNEAESDDPLRLATSQTDPSRAAAAQSGQSGQGRSRRGGGGGSMPGFGTIPGGPAMPGVDAMGDGLRWPGKDMEIKQVAGVVAVTSGGANQVYQPRSVDLNAHQHKPNSGNDAQDRDMRDRDMPERDRGEGLPVRCGWEEATLVILGGDADEGRPSFEERYTLSEDRQRLVEVVGFKGGRSGGFTLSRTWDRVPP